MADRVLIVGSIALDDIATPHGERIGVLGGSAVYGAVAAARFAPVDIVGVVGGDFPEVHLDRLRALGVDTRGVERIAEGKTFHWGGEYRGEMNEAVTRFTELGVFAQFEPRLPESYRRDAFVFLANIDPELQLAVLDQVERPRLVVADSMNLWIDGKRDRLLEVLRRVDVALLNDAEARRLWGTHSLPEAARRLLELGLERVIIKKGSHGAQMFSREGEFAVPAMTLERVVDPTGAGDSFAGGLIGYLARLGRCDEMAFRQAVLVGTASASFAVEAFSVDRAAEATLDELRARCARLLDALRCDAPRLD